MKTRFVKRVLIALDYNLTDEKIAKVGYAIAETMEADVTLLHVLSYQTNNYPIAHDPIMGYAGFSDLDIFQPDYKENLKKAAEDFLTSVKNHLGDSKIETIVKEGKCSEVILATAKKINADIIIMGSHSKKWLEKILMGNTAKEVLEDTTVPLLIIPTAKKK